MFKNVILAASAAAFLSSCTAETYIEFDNLMLEINGLEIDSSVGIDSNSVNQLAQTASETTSSPPIVEEEYVEKLDFNFYKDLDALAEVEIGGKIYYLQSIQKIEGEDWSYHITHAFGKESSGAYRVTLTPSMFPESDLDFYRLYLHWRIEDLEFLYTNMPFDEFDEGKDDFSLILNQVSSTPHPNFNSILNLWNALENYVEDMNIDYSSLSSQEDCTYSSVEGFVNGLNQSTALGIPLQAFVDNFISPQFDNIEFDGMKVVRAEGWDEWGSELVGESIKIGHIILDVKNSDLDLVLVYNFESNDYLMTIVFGVEEFWESRIHFGNNNGNSNLTDNSNSFWYDCDIDAFKAAIDWLKNYLG